MQFPMVGTIFQSYRLLLTYYSIIVKSRVRSNLLLERKILCLTIRELAHRVGVGGLLRLSRVRRVCFLCLPSKHRKSTCYKPQVTNLTTCHLVLAASTSSTTDMDVETKHGRSAGRQSHEEIMSWVACMGGFLTCHEAAPQ